MEWRYTVSPCSAPKIFECKYPLEKFSPRLFLVGSRRHPPHILSSKKPIYQVGVLLISAGAIEGYFEGKTLRRGVTNVALFLHENTQTHWALATQKKLF
jgi:hypothetical protein